MTEAETKKALNELAELKENIVEMIEEAKKAKIENKENISFSILEIEALITYAKKGDKKAQEVLDFLSQGDNGKEVVRTVEIGLEQQKEINTLLKGKSNLKKASAKTLKQVIEKYDAIKSNPILEVYAKRPKEFLLPTDKISNTVFKGLIDSVLTPVAVEKKGSKKTVTNMVSINFDEIQEHGLSIRGRREITAYDQVIHDAVVTLTIDGDNDVVTTNMIYQTITGNTGHATGVTAKAAQAISESITKLMYSRLILDATEEEDAFNKIHLSKDSPLLPAERLTVSINGQIQEAIHILKTPPLYEYANSTDRIARIDMKLLNSPINKNEEIITLQDYLLRRIVAMQNPKNSLKPTIKYDTLYEHLNITAPTQGALRKKKATIRKYVKTILDYWVEEDFIKGYIENKRKNEIYSVTVRY